MESTRADDIIKKAKQLNCKMQGILKHPRGSQESRQEFLNHLGSKLASGSTNLNLADSKEQSQNSSQNISRGSEKEISKSNSFSKNTANESNEFLSLESGGSLNKKMKMRITNCHELEIHAKDVKKVKEEFNNQEKPQPLNSKLLKGSITCGSTMEEQVLLNSLKDQSGEKSVESEKQRQNTGGKMDIADKARLLREKA